MKNLKLIIAIAALLTVVLLKAQSGQDATLVAPKQAYHAPAELTAQPRPATPATKAPVRRVAPKSTVKQSSTNQAEPAMNYKRAPQKQ